MSSNRQLNVILLLIIASLIGIAVLFVRKTVSFECDQTDPQVCRFLDNYKKMSKRMQGMYTVQSTNDESTQAITWQLDNENRSITATQKEETILEAVIMKEYVYLKDYTDNKWWKQKIADSQLIESSLPFDPYNYFKELELILLNPQTTYTLIGDVKCGNKNCIRYQISTQQQSEDLQRFIYITTPDFKPYIVIDANSSSSHEIKMANSDKYISEPEMTKIPQPDKNIFLDYLSRREKEREKKLDYLKQFQTEREKAEGIPIDEQIIKDTETATESSGGK